MSDNGHQIEPALKGLAVPIGSIHLDPANVRRHNERNLDSIKASLLAFGQQKPVVVDQQGQIIAGNGTWEAAKALGWTKIAAVRSELDGYSRTAYAIADNRTAELASWDDEGLAATLNELRNAKALEPTGFDTADLDRLLQGLSIPETNQQIDEEAMGQTEHECPSCGFKW